MFDSDTFYSIMVINWTLWFYSVGFYGQFKNILKYASLNLKKLSTFKNGKNQMVTVIVFHFQFKWNFS